METAQHRTAPKPRGMAVARHRAIDDYRAGKGITDCPYTAEAWRTLYLETLLRCQQGDLFDGFVERD